MEANDLRSTLIHKLAQDISAKNDICVGIGKCDPFDPLDCSCAKQAEEYIDLILQEAANHGWKLTPRDATEEMAQAAQFTTAWWLDIKGSQLTVNLEKAKRRWAAMHDKVSSSQYR